MNWGKVFALSLRHIYLIKGSFPRILDLIYWPTIQIFLWGFISKFFTLSSSYFENTVGIKEFLCVSNYAITKLWTDKRQSMIK